MTAATLVLFAVIGLLGGVGISAVGPGGVLPTIGLFALTGLSPSMVAGTAIVTHVATGLLGSAAYLHSGQLREKLTRRTALILCASAVVGAPIGTLINSVVSGRAFGSLLGMFVALVGALVLYRERRFGSRLESAHPRHSVFLLSGIGVTIAAVSSMFGVGGPMLAVPLLIALGTPVLSALAAAQTQSVVIATVGTVGYLAQGAISWPLALLVGIPELLGVLIGWKIGPPAPSVGRFRPGGPVWSCSAPGLWLFCGCRGR